MSGILRKILVAIDGAGTGRRIVSFAIALARRHGSEVVLCNAVDHATAIGEVSSSGAGPDLVGPLLQELDDNAASILAEAERRVADAGLVATTVTLDGRSGDVIVACANECHADAIVMGTAGKRGLTRFFRGSTAAEVLRRADLPIFVVPPGASDAPSNFWRMLVAIDDSDPSDAAAAFGLDLAAADDAQLIFAGVCETSAVLDNVANSEQDPTPLIGELLAVTTALVDAHVERARHGKLTAEGFVAQGNPAEEILKIGEANHAELIVVGTHGRRGLRRLFVGSVAESVVCRSTVPVVVIRAFPKPIKSLRRKELAAVIGR